MLIVIVHGINLGYGILQRLEVTVQDAVLPDALAVDEVADTVVRLIAPSAYTYLYAFYSRRPCLQGLHILYIVGLLVGKYILAILADGLAVSSQCAVGFNADVEQDDIRESRLLQRLHRLGTFATDMSTDVDAGVLSHTD